MDQFLYNSDRSTNTANQRSFTVGSKPLLISNAGLDDCVPIYVSIGGCRGCGFSDQIWTPYMICGEPVEVCPDSTNLVISVPGRYVFGDPEVENLVLPGDVNVTRKELTDNLGLIVSEARCCGDNSETLCEPAEARGLVTSWP